MTPPDARCEQTDLVLARFLDGEPTRGSESTAHLASCPECQSALRRARRLDALLAQHSTGEVADALADRLLTAAFPATVPTRRNRLPLALGAVTLVLGGVALGMWLRGSRPAHTPTTARGGAPGVARTPPVDTGRAGDPPGVLRLPEARRFTGSVERSILPRSRTRSTDAAILGRADLASMMLPTVVVLRGLHGLATPGCGGAWPSWPDLQHTAERLARDARIEAGTKLMRSRRTSAHRQLTAFLATSTDGAVLRELLAAARDDAATVRRIHAALGRGRPDEEVIVAAARLGHPRLDAAILRVVRRWPPTAHSIVQAVATTGGHPRRVESILDVWSELRGRRACGARETRLLESSFRRLPASATGELVSLAGSAKRPGRRLQCLTALGWRADPAAVGFLLGLVDSRHHETALAAGHVLSRMPLLAEKEIAAGLGRSRRVHVLLAALCAMRSKLPRAKLRTADLTDEETAFLWSGAFTSEQFGIACALCRRRSVLSD